MTDHSKEELTMSRALLEDFKRYAARDMRNQIVGVLQDRLDLNKTRTMTFTEDGLELAIKLIEEMND